MMELGTVVGGRYRLKSVLGEGGMGIVYAAQECKGGALVALKMLSPGFSKLPELRRRFEREGHATGFLQHPHIVSVREMGTMDDGAMYLVMEHVRGESVGQLCEAGALHPRRALILLRQTLLGLSYAHQHGLVHRDLKPDNIMVAKVGQPGREYEQVKLLDFGVVKVLADAAIAFDSEKLTQTGVVFGTPSYMSPEQALGRPVDGRADLYSAGVVLFEMLTGKPLFDGGDPLSIMRMHVSQSPPDLGDAVWCTPSVRALVNRSLAKTPDDRFASALAMASAVDEAFLSIDHLVNEDA